MHMKQVALFLLVVALGMLSCRGSGEPTTPPQPEPPPPPPPSPQVELLELIPTQSSFALLVEVGALRQTNYGDGLLEAIRSVGETSEWEQIAEIDLESGVERLLFFGRVDESTGSTGDLTRIMSRMSAHSAGVVFERTSTVGEAMSDCRRSDLEESQLAPVDGPMEHSYMARCGRFVIVACCEEQPLQLTHHDSSAAGALARLETAENDATGARRVASAVFGPSALNHASCDRTRIGLTGWHSATAAIGDGLTVNGRIHAETPAAAPLLEECIEDAVAEIANYTLLQQLGVSGLLTGIEVDRDPADDKDILVTVPLDAQQTDFLMSLVGLLGGGMP